LRKKLKAFLWEFGYTLDVDQRVSLAANSNPCTRVARTLGWARKFMTDWEHSYSFGVQITLRNTGEDS
jgi:hypothetical protein